MMGYLNKKWLIPILIAGLISIITGGFEQPVCEAEIVEGAAVYEGNGQKAREAAIRDAMRSLLETKVGMYVRSNSEVDMGVLVTDKIVSRSTGYVKINSVLSEGVQGGIYVVKVDLECDDTNIETKYRDDVAKAMTAILEPKIANVAVIGYGLDGTVQRDERAVNIVGQYLNEMGIQLVVNDNVARLLAHSPNPLPAELRQLARNDGDNEANSVLCGTLRDTAVTLDSSGYYRAAVEASFSFVGIQNGYAQNYMERFTGVGRTADEAVFAARREAASTAAEYLAGAALKTIQFENRGGVNNLNTTVEIHGIRDRASQSAFFNSLLEGANCRITRAGFSPQGVYKIKIIGTGWDDLYELSQEIVKAAGDNGIALIPLESTTKIVLQVQ
ncbi:MAG: hypothetical protein K6C05_03010 [Anaerovibrio sp.]|uniref:hypothetical protein n=1 Tax=Anaerovibrio sp. TaxID=1872532 RepID=UPI0025D673DE|nr:hypothetical protein [Anaerovibrio sp.]MCR5175801.1 hypothetical protein [Anaerovibrio sp.]